MAITDPILATFVNATTFTATTDSAGQPDLSEQCAIGVKIKVNCGADGYRYGVVSSVNYSAPTTTIQIAGDDLTANLVSFWHSNDTPNSLPTHDHAGPDGGGNLLDYVKANGSTPFVDCHIPAEGATYTGFKFTQLNAPTDEKKSFHQVTDSRVSLLLSNDAETAFHEAWSVGRDGATPTDMTVNTLLIAAGGLNADTVNGQDVTSGIVTRGNGPVVAQCRLTLSGSTLLLSPHDGRTLTIDATIRALSSSGPTLAATGVANTLYYIYAYWTGSEVALEASTTAYSADSRNSMMTKTGDATRSLVGAARTDASGAWVNNSSQRLVCSYYNRILTSVLLPAMASNLTTSSTTAVNTNKSVEFVVFPGYYTFGCAAYFSNTSVTSNRYDIKKGSSVLSSFFMADYVAGQQTLFTQTTSHSFSGYAKLDAYFYVASGTGTLYSYSGFQIMIDQ